ncbi:hypothetical protein [Streptomyces virginiae]|uniref:hypothetical protein n=1 Tax=Streptomyces virginiae TaxID=1961 RepID=UPI00225A93BA|nr:hypothetical protein [Streptomyces virginiae]MCX5174380.1 hypothetical protein [Streptomyces virginiae]
MKKAWSCAASTPEDAGPTRRHGAGRPTAAPTAGRGNGWLLITRRAAAVEVRPLPDGGKAVHAHLTAGL